jgi:uncharacterized protein (DUF1800 family)
VDVGYPVMSSPEKTVTEREQRKERYENTQREKVRLKATAVKRKRDEQIAKASKKYREEKAARERLKWYVDMMFVSPMQLAMRLTAVY